ncbi:MAG: succinylglutamate desuccinylase/aspartoacylase family protein [Alphaproteobacteria bacterium]|nr:N-alpha-acetyl diaminobutyric acid deacetylase DoeB [Rhodospirillaceae bacterium]MBT6510402.1 N-alpha-acetyl diaminobutyric acid deacetylase DoeB [Rhodospirillaceae bacterium]MDG2481776.1 succinylglutamate desuccinylase/aspartoacylase family protein [Alphaproteobacteria bacterium]
MTDSKISANVDYEADGKQVGWLTIPHSRNESGWGAMHMPISVIKNGSGPTVLFTGGNHGDEYEGQIALMKLVRGLDPAEVQGRIIVIPHLNYPAMRANARLSPIDGGNMNRVFPGKRDGTITEMIAHYVSTAILPCVDAALDLHSGGRSMLFEPAAIMHRFDDAAMFDKTMAATRAFGAPVSLVLTELDAAGMLDSTVEDAGKLFLSTELGGGQFTSPRTVEIADTGVRNVLKYLDVLEGDPVERPTRIMDTPDGAYVTARDHGILEPLLDVGTEVKAGDAVACIHDFDNPERDPVVYRSNLDGMLLVRHLPGLITRGDCLAVVASDLEL